MIKDKKAILVVPFEEKNLNTATPLINMFEKSLEYLEITLIEKIIVPGVTKKGEVSEIANIMNKCFEVGKKIAK